MATKSASASPDDLTSMAAIIFAIAALLSATNGAFPEQAVNAAAAATSAVGNGADLGRVWHGERRDRVDKYSYAAGFVARALTTAGVGTKRGYERPALVTGRESAVATIIYAASTSTASAPHGRLARSPRTQLSAGG